MSEKTIAWLMGSVVFISLVHMGISVPREIRETYRQNMDAMNECKRRVPQLENYIEHQEQRIDMVMEVLAQEARK